MVRVEDPVSLEKNNIREQQHIEFRVLLSGFEQRCCLFRLAKYPVPLMSVSHWLQLNAVERL